MTPAPASAGMMHGRPRVERIESEMSAFASAITDGRRYIGAVVNTSEGMVFSMRRSNSAGV